VGLGIACDGGLNLVGQINQPQQTPEFGNVQGIQFNGLNNL
jgi:hypothetical protein